MTTGYLILAVILIGLLAFDLYSHRAGKEITLRSATAWSIFYLACGIGFGGYIWMAYSAEWAQLYLTGYALEKVLAVDNLFAFMIIFSYFGIASKYQHRILYWGILGAIVFRGLFVALGTSFTAIFGPWAELIFAAIIGWTAYKMLTSDGDGDSDEGVDYKNAWYVRILSRFLPVTDTVKDNNFFVREPNKVGRMVWHATPFFVCLVAIEISDVVFAFDSVPAIIAVTKEPFLVYAAMMFAILGLRSLYFVLEALRRILSKLETMVIVILLFIAGKLGIAATSELAIRFGILDLEEAIHIHPGLSLGIVMTLLATGVLWSIYESKKNPVITSVEPEPEPIA
jgi:tellurite resistance protein TerC